MLLHLTPNRLALVLLSLSLMTSCIKTSSLVNTLTTPPPTTINTDTIPPAITSVGTPVGTPVSQTIGPNGGSITSSDGAVQLTIPAGALSTNTTITIQPVTSECPGGLGLGYDFLPNGTQFAKPAILSFPYWQQDSVNDPNLFFVAYQANDGSWMADLSGVDIDTTAKTLSLGISHFTIYQMLAGMYIYNTQPNSEYNKGESSALQVMETFDPGSPGFNANNGTVQLIQAPVPNSLVDHWFIAFPDAYHGVFDSQGSAAIFYAPSQIDPATPYNTIIARLHLTLLIPGKNGKTKSIKDPGLVRRVGFIPEYSYDIKISMTATGMSNYYSDIYTDSASFHVDVDPIWYNNTGGNGNPREVGAYHVSLSNEQNYPPNDQPPHHETADYTIDWLPDTYGLINITGAQVASADARITKSITILFTEPGTDYPGWKVIDNSSGNNIGTPPAPQPGMPGVLTYSFWDSSQYQFQHDPQLPMSYSVNITSN